MKFALTEIHIHSRLENTDILGVRIRMGKRTHLFGRLFPPFVILIALSLAAVFWYATVVVENLSREQSTENLTNQAAVLSRLFQGRLSRENAAELDAALKRVNHRIHVRLTIALPTGEALADSIEAVANVTSLASRPEIQEAAAGNVGRAVRRSLASDKDLLFVAMPIKEGAAVTAIVRAAGPMENTQFILRNHRWEIAGIAVVLFLSAALFCFLIARGLSQSLEEVRLGIESLGEGRLDTRLPRPHVEELATLTSTFNRAAGALQSKVMIITQERNELEVVLSSMTEAVVVLDTNERLLSVNQAAENLLGIENERVKGRTVQEAVRNTDLHRFVTNTLAGKEPIEGDIVFMGEPERFLQAHGAALQDTRGHNIGALVVLNDVTRLKTLENIRRDFVANVSHELKTPITSIKGFLETLREGAMDDPEHAKRFLEIIMKHTDRLDSIIEDLLSLSRIERDAEKGEIALDSGSVGDVIELAAANCRRRAQLREIEIKTTLEPDLVTRVNPQLLEQALINLVDNAVKYSDREKTVEIEAKKLAAEIIIKVKDKGCGISKEHLSRIFERFYRVDKARSRNVGGTGLGLSIVKHIVNAHGGRVAVDSSPNKGSVFSIYLPLPVAVSEVRSAQ